MLKDFSMVIWSFVQNISDWITSKDSIFFYRDYCSIILCCCNDEISLNEKSQIFEPGLFEKIEFGNEGRLTNMKDIHEHLVTVQ